MKASTHTELYRPFEGQFRERPRRALVLARSALRQAFRKKMPALFLFGPGAILGIGFSVAVNMQLLFLKQQFQVQPDNPDVPATPEQLEAKAEAIQVWMEQVVERIVGAPGIPGFLTWGVLFMLLAMVWYGSGMISDDRRLGANLLYFARPLTRKTYGFGKFLGLSLIGVLTLVTPAMLICTTAIFVSPDWEFLTEEWDTIVKILGFTTLWVAIASLVILGLSSLVTRRTQALILSLGLILILDGIARIAAEMTDVPSLIRCSLFHNFATVSNWLFDKPESSMFASASASGWALVVTAGLALALLSRGIKKMEVVG